MEWFWRESRANRSREKYHLKAELLHLTLIKIIMLWNKQTVISKFYSTQHDYTLLYEYLVITEVPQQGVYHDNKKKHPGILFSCSQKPSWATFIKSTIVKTLTWNVKNNGASNNTIPAVPQSDPTLYQCWEEQKCNPWRKMGRDCPQELQWQHRGVASPPWTVGLVWILGRNSSLWGPGTSEKWLQNRSPITFHSQNWVWSCTNP